jgi:hypothetical protein
MTQFEHLSSVSSLVHEPAPGGSGPRIEDIPRIALVSRRFMELQGLLPAAVGAGLILSSLLSHLVGAPGQSGGPLGALVFCCLLVDPLTQYLQRRYRQSFGDAVATTLQKFLAAMPFIAVMTGALIDTAIYQSPSPRPGPSFVGIALACYSTWVLLRDWRWRTHYLAALAAGLAGIVVTASVIPSPGTGGIDPARTDAFLLAYALAGFGLVIAGLFDHYVLASALRRRGSKGPGFTQENGTANVDTI